MFKTKITRLKELQERETDLWSWIAVFAVSASALFLFSYANAEDELLTEATLGSLAGSSKVNAATSAAYSYAQAAKHGAQCGFGNPLSCLRAAASGTTALNATKSAFKNENSENVATCGVDGYCGQKHNFNNGNSGPTGKYPYGGPGSGADPITAELEKIKNNTQGVLNQLEEKGYGFDGKTGQLYGPGGPIDGNKLNSEEGQKELGATDAQIAEFEATNAAADKEGKKAVQIVLNKLGKNKDQFAGGGRASRGIASVSDDDIDWKKFFNQKDEGQKRGVAGLTVQYGSQPIGVAADNIFDMMNRRYTSETSQGTFLLDPKGHVHSPKGPQQSRWYIPSTK